MCKVFYVPGHTAIIDYARQIGPNMWMAQHSGLMLPELRVRYPGAILGDEEAFLIDQERAYGTPPARTTAARRRGRKISSRRPRWRASGPNTVPTSPNTSASGTSSRVTA